MLVGEGGGGTEQTGLGMGDELHRHLVHPPFEPALGDEAIAETRRRQAVAEAQADTPGNDHRRRSMRQGEIAGDCTEA
jgi:hypothetical protein